MGYETNLPFKQDREQPLDSTFQRRHVVFPGARNHDLTNYNLGAAALSCAVSRDLNLMLETIAGWNEDIAEGVLSPERTTTAPPLHSFLLARVTRSI